MRKLIVAATAAIVLAFPAAAHAGGYQTRCLGRPGAGCLCPTPIAWRMAACVYGPPRP